MTTEGVIAFVWCFITLFTVWFWDKMIKSTIKESTRPLTDSETLELCWKSRKNLGLSALPRDVIEQIIKTHLDVKEIFYDPRCNHRLFRLASGMYVHDSRFSRKTCPYSRMCVMPCISCKTPETAGIHRLCPAHYCLCGSSDLEPVGFGWWRCRACQNVRFLDN